MNYRRTVYPSKHRAVKKHSDLFTCDECHQKQTKTISFDRRNLRKNVDEPVVSLKNLFKWNKETICRTCWERMP